MFGRRRTREGEECLISGGGGEGVFVMRRSTRIVY